MSNTIFVNYDDYDDKGVKNLGSQTIFESGSDSIFNQYQPALDNLVDVLSKFALSKNQSKVYIFLGKYGSHIATQISKALKIPRTETYAILNSLQNMGLLTTILDHPTKYVALPFKDAIKFLINSEQERVNALKKDGEEFEKIWEKIPDFSTPAIGKEVRLQTLRGKNTIVSKINEMCQNASQLIVLGREQDYVMFYHSEILDLINKSIANVRLLSSCSKETMHVFDDMDKMRIKIIPEKLIENFGFIIKDDAEAMLFIKNEVANSHELIAVSTDSISIISSLKLSFNLLWSNKKNSMIELDDILYV